MNGQILPLIEKDLIIPRYFGWKGIFLEAITFNLFHKNLKFVAKQIALPAQRDPRGAYATAKITITDTKTDKILLSEDCPWILLKGDNLLLLHIYMLSKEPNSKCKDWQPYFEKFCESFEQFEKPEQLYWSETNEFFI